MDKDILKRKLHLQKVRNCLANLKGVEVVRFCGNDEHEKIYSIEQKYFPHIYFLEKTQDSIINIRTLEELLFSLFRCVGRNSNYRNKSWNTEPMETYSLFWAKT